MAKSNSVDSGKATITVGAPHRVDKTVYDDFARNCKDSDLDKKDGQSQRETVLEELMKRYNRYGNTLWGIIDNH